jgi:hypothetical protein
MQFTYSNSNNYLAGAKEVNDISTNIYNTARQTGVDTNKLIETERKARATKSDAKNAAEGTVGRTAVSTLAGIKKGDIERKSKKDVENIMKPAKRMAGVLALTNTGLAVKKMGQDAAMDAKERAETKRIRDENASQYASEMAELKKLREAQIAALTKTDEPASAQTTTSPTSPTTTSTISSTSSLPLAAGTTLTGASKTVADAIAGPESGSYGYEAFNQGGEKGGTAIPVGFKSGNYKETFGTSLTDKTIGEIMELQRDPGRSVLSDSDWVSSGKLHAVGRYQFIGDTFRDEVNRMGISKDTKFTPEVQDQIFLSHLKRVGNISPWVGPSTQYSPEKIAELNSLITTL